MKRIEHNTRKNKKGSKPAHVRGFLQTAETPTIEELEENALRRDYPFPEGGKVLKLLWEPVYCLDKKRLKGIGA